MNKKIGAMKFITFDLEIQSLELRMDLDNSLYPIGYRYYLIEGMQ